MSERTVRSWVSKLNDDGVDAFVRGRKWNRRGNPKANRRGKPPLSERDKDHILASIKRKKGLRPLSKKLPRGLEASKSTLHRIGKSHGWSFKKKSHKPKLTRTHKRKRDVLANQTSEFNWLAVCACDEVTVLMCGVSNPHNEGEWLPPGESASTVPTVKYPISEHRFAAVTSEGGLPLVPCAANPNATQCQQLLETVLPMIEAKLGYDYCLLHDNLPGRSRLLCFGCG